MEIIATGDESAKCLDIDADRLRNIILVLVSLVTAAVVSFTGMMGFVGLVAPHMVRLFIGADTSISCLHPLHRARCFSRSRTSWAGL